LEEEISIRDAALQQRVAHSPTHTHTHTHTYIYIYIYIYIPLLARIATVVINRDYIMSHSSIESDQACAMLLLRMIR